MAIVTACTAAAVAMRRFAPSRRDVPGGAGQSREIQRGAMVARVRRQPAPVRAAV